MAETIVKDITDSGKALILSTLGAPWAALDYEHDLEENNFQKRPKRFGFIALGGEFDEGRTLKHVTFTHDFQLILTTDFYNQDDDSNLVVAKNLIFEAAHDLMGVMVNKKVGLPSRVLLTNGISIEEPEFLSDNTIVSIRVNLSIQYRYPTS
jgi:hypothetical protein